MKAKRMNHKRTLISIVAAIVLVSLFAVVSSAASVSGTVMAGTGPAASTSTWTEIYAVDTSGTLWNTSQGTGTWNYVGGVCTSSPAAVSWGSNNARDDVFVRGSDGAVWQIYNQNGWSGWIPLGGQVASGTGPSVCSWGSGRLDVFVQGTDGQMWHKWWNGAKWSGWESLGGQLTSGPAATSPWTVGVINVFVRGTDGAVWQKYYQNGWSGWHSLGGQLAPNTGPAVCQDLTLMVQGTDNQLWQKTDVYPTASGWVSGWSAWSTLNTEPPVALSIASPGIVNTVVNMHPLVCISSTSGDISYSVRDVAGNWDSWYSAGSPP
jgi:hypothetical protein